MRILVIEPLGEIGHINFDKAYLKVLESIGEVTLMTFPRLHKYFNIKNRIELPESFEEKSSNLLHRINQLKVLIYIQKHFPLTDFDAIIFFCYDEISFSLSWPNSNKTFLMEHNNIDSVNNSFIKKLFYNRIGNNIHHLVFETYIKEYLTRNYKKKTHQILHPHYYDNIDDLLLKHPVIPQKGNPRKIIFSPSLNNDHRVMLELKNFVIANDDYFFLAKNKYNEKTKNYRFEKYFDNYSDELKNCSYVFISADYNYRVSGVLYDALSFGKKIVIKDCLFARVIQKVYPNSISIINNIDEFKLIPVSELAQHQERASLLENHSFGKLITQLKIILDEK